MTKKLLTLFAALLTVIAVIAGAAFIAESFAVGATGKNRNLMFLLFWGGMLLGSIPLLLWMINRSSTPVSRSVALSGLAGLMTLPKILRSPFTPLFHDEYAHLRAVEDILSTGLPGGFNSIVTPVPDFPGMHAVTAWLSSITALSSWTSALVIIAIAHIVGLIGIYVLLSVLGVSYRGAAVGAAVYATNANYMFFHAQFGYESLGLPLVIWGLIVAVYAIRSPRPRKWILVAAIGPLSYAIAAIHHLSAVGFALTLLIIAIYTSLHSVFVRKYRHALTSWMILAVASVFIYIRFIPTLSLLAEYLGSPASRGTTQLQEIANQFVGRGSDSPNSRTLFEESKLPLYEQIASFGATLIIGVAVATMIILWFLKKIGKTTVWIVPEGSPVRNAFLMFTILYLASVPFILTSGGAEGARRSWGYSFLGVALLFAILFDMLDTRNAAIGRGKNSYISTASFVALWSILLVGGVAAGVNETYRFPSPQTKVSDLTASTDEAVAIGQWVRENVERDSWVAADRYVGMQIASTGMAQVVPASPSFPYWDVYWKTEAPSISLLAGMNAFGVQFIVVDQRMEQEVPENGYWFAGGEPRYPRGGVLPPAEPNSLAKFDNLSIFTKVFSTENYRIYRVNYEIYNPYQVDREIGALYGTE